MLAQWCLTAWNMAIGRPNCSRTLAYSAASSVHSRAMPAASAARIVRARSTSTWRAPGMTSAAAPSSVTRAARRVGSRFGGVSTVDASGRTIDDRDVVADRRPAARRPDRRRAPRRRTRTPFAVAVHVRRRRRARPRRWSSPSARPGRSRACSSSGAAAASTALAITVGTNGPGAMARPSSSTTTTSSGRPKPDPPCSSGMCSPSQPRSLRSSQNGGPFLGLGLEQRAGRASGVALQRGSRRRCRRGRGGHR